MCIYIYVYIYIYIYMNSETAQQNFPYGPNVCVSSRVYVTNLPLQHTATRCNTLIQLVCMIK